MTYAELEKSLKPCPLCGGPACLVDITSSFRGITVTITCSFCGLTLEHTHPNVGPYFNAVEAKNGIDLWNTRTEG